MEKAFQYAGFQQFQVTVGADYTLGIGNGLTTTVEYFHYNGTVKINSDPIVWIKCPFPFYPQDQNFTALGLNYPLGLVDYLSAMVYYDIELRDCYRFVDWQRTLSDYWTLHLMGYWNSDNGGIFSGINSGQMVSGKGFQLLLVCNF